LPNSEKQKEVFELFRKLQIQIDNTIEQERNLIALRTKLTTELVCKEARFGKLLNSDNCKPTSLGTIAKETRENTKTPLDEGIERFVGLEHIEPGNLKIQGWGNVADGTTFTKVFKIGDVLFGRRRAYLKKAAHADFTGICSGDITVLRANSKLILADLLPYYLSADPVFEFAVSNSAGSLSPRAKWRDLSKYEISLPDLKVQEEILETFQLLDANITSNKEQRSTLKKLKHQLLDEILG
jgi:type I restriction enzyme S subunit